MNLFENIKKNLKESEDGKKYQKKNNEIYFMDQELGVERPIPSREEWEEEWNNRTDREDYADTSYEGLINSLEDDGTINHEQAKQYLSDKDKEEYNYIKPLESKDINLNSALSILDEVDHKLVKDKHFELSYELSKVINLLNSLILSDKDLMTDETKEELKKRYNEAANPANEEKNKIIRDALKGPKSYNKNLKALQKMGINKNSKEMEEDDYGRTIYLHGPNGRHVSVDPDGTNIWSTFSTRDEDHYKKELDFENRNSSNYNNQEHLDFNGKRAKDFDYYNYLHKPENKYQEEVDQANKVKGYRDNEDKTGYNLPDEALTPEEKSLNKRPRKYVQLSKDRKELEDELAGYSETKKQLDKVNRKIKKLHKK